MRSSSFLGGAAGIGWKYILLRFCEHPSLRGVSPPRLVLVRGPCLYRQRRCQQRLYGGFHCGAEAGTVDLSVTAFGLVWANKPRRASLDRTVPSASSGQARAAVPG